MLLSKTRKIVLIIGLLLIIMILYYRLYYPGERLDNVKYPTYTPYTEPFNTSDFPVTFNDAKNIAFTFLKEKAGVDLSMVKLDRIRGFRTHLAFHDGIIALYLSPKTGERGFLYIFIEASTGRVVYLWMSDNLYPDQSSCIVPSVSEDEARSIVKDFLKEIGFRIDDNIDVEINYAEKGGFSNTLFIYYNITIYGYRIYNQRMGDGTLELCLSAKKYYVGFRIPFEVLHAYELGLFIKPPNTLPIDKDTALKKAIDYLREKLEISEYEYSLKGVYWYFKFIKSVVINRTIYHKFYDPVPHLVYVYEFKIALINGDQITRTVLVDAITGDII